MSALGDKTNDELADGICTWAGRLAAGEAELLEWIAEYDRREAWVGVGLLSCAHWLSWRIGLSPGAAREKVRVARALPALPVVREAYAAGRLSYSQVRAISRAATADDQERWVELARSSTAGQLERLVRGVRRVRAVQEAEADPEATSWRLRARKSWDADGNAVYTIVLPAEQAAVLDIAIETVRQQLDAETKAEEVKGVPAETSPPPPVEAPPRPTEGDLDLGPIISRGSTVADAVLHMARSVLEAQAQACPADRDTSRPGRGTSRPRSVGCGHWSRPTCVGTTRAGTAGCRKRHCESWSPPWTGTAAGSRAARGTASCTPTMSSTGAPAGGPTSVTCCCCAVGTTRWSTPRASSSG